MLIAKIYLSCGMAFVILCSFMPYVRANLRDEKRWGVVAGLLLLVLIWPMGVAYAAVGVAQGLRDRRARR